MLRRELWVGEGVFEICFDGARGGCLFGGRVERMLLVDKALALMGADFVFGNG